MKTIQFVTLVSMLLLIDASSLRKEKLNTSKNLTIGAESNSDVSIRRDKRIAIATVWTAMGIIKDFAVRVELIQDTISDVKSWFGINDDAGTVPEDRQAVIDNIRQVKGDVTDLKDEALAGQEWGFVLAVVGEPIKNLNALVYQEEDYLDKMQESSFSDALKKVAQNRFFVTEVNDQSCGNLRNLASFQNGILSGTGDIHTPLYEAYAEKVGVQGTGTFVDVARFIGWAQNLQAQVYAVLQEGVDFKPSSAADKIHEKELYDYDVRHVRPNQTPRVAKAINIIMKHKGSTLWGRIKVKYGSHAGKCLSSMVHANTPSDPAFIFLKTCSEGISQQWLLTEEFHIGPKSHTDHAMYLQVYSPEYTTRWSCYIDGNFNPRPRVTGQTSSSALVKYEFSTTDVSLFQIRVQTSADSEICLTSHVGDSSDIICTKPCVEIDSSDSGDTWFEWEPIEA